MQRTHCDGPSLDSMSNSYTEEALIRREKADKSVSEQLACKKRTNCCYGFVSCDQANIDLRKKGGNIPAKSLGNTTHLCSRKGFPFPFQIQQ